MRVRCLASAAVLLASLFAPWIETPALKLVPDGRLPFAAGVDDASAWSGVPRLAVLLVVAALLGVAAAVRPGRLGRVASAFAALMAVITVLWAPGTDALGWGAVAGVAAMVWLAGASRALARR